MKHLLDTFDGFFFARRRAWPFGLMRIGWASVALAFFLMQWNDVAAYYSDSGFLPRDLVMHVTRQDWIFSALFFSGSEWFARVAYFIMLLSLVCMIIGIAPRISTVLSVLLMFSFHERNAMTLGGGDTVLRNVGFILMLAPGIQALSLWRAIHQWKHWKTARVLLPALTMPAWPYRLLLWQMIMIYGSSLWFKLLGQMWLDGTAVGAALHHLIFVKWSYDVLNFLMPIAPFITWATLVWETSWLLLLVPRSFAQLVAGPKLQFPMKRIILIGGVLFHGSIAFLMDVGSFPYALLAGYMGLLDDRDRAWLKRILDRKQTHPIVVLYDGSCRLCRRSAFVLALLDTFSHLHLTDFRNDAARKEVAPHLDESQLDLALHILLPDRRPGEASAKSGQSIRTGYDAFRFMAWHLPLLWIAAPFLYLPGITHLGRQIYAWTAKNRTKCTHDRC